MAETTCALSVKRTANATAGKLRHERSTSESASRRNARASAFPISLGAIVGESNGKPTSLSSGEEQVPLCASSVYRAVLCASTTFATSMSIGGAICNTPRYQKKEIFYFPLCKIFAPNIAFAISLSLCLFSSSSFAERANIHEQIIIISPHES